MFFNAMNEKKIKQKESISVFFLENVLFFSWNKRIVCFIFVLNLILVVFVF